MLIKTHGARLAIVDFFTFCSCCCVVLSRDWPNLKQALETHSFNSGAALAFPIQYYPRTALNQAPQPTTQVSGGWGRANGNSMSGFFWGGFFFFFCGQFPNFRPSGAGLGHTEPIPTTANTCRRRPSRALRPRFRPSLFLFLFIDSNVIFD